MKRFTIGAVAVILIVAVAFVVGITGPDGGGFVPPAAAGHQDGQARANCSTFDNVKSASKPVPVGTADANWRVYVWLWWRNCTNGLEARQYRVMFAPTDPGHCYRLNEWRVNPNIIGNYNPGTRYIDCDGNDDRQATWDLHQEFIPNGSDASKRCLGAQVTASITLANDQTFGLPSLCVPLT